jgi:hypothetical protein
MEDAKAAVESDARRLQQELSLANAARDSLLHFEGQLAQVKRDQATMLQNRIKETVASCQEGHSREKAQLSVRRWSSGTALDVSLPSCFASERAQAR